MSMPRKNVHYNVAMLNRPDLLSQAEMEEVARRRHEANARSRDLDAAKYNATVMMGSVPCPAKYIGTRRKDGWHFMEVRMRASFQSRTYVMPRQVEWKGEPPEIKWGDKVKDFV